jgi:GxxExxY protein
MWDQREYPHAQLTERIIGCAIEVHRHLGPGYLELFYKRAMTIEMGLRGLRFEPEAPFGVRYKGRYIGGHPADFDVERTVLVEAKAIDAVIPRFRAIGYSYLKAAKRQVLLIINFQVPVLKDGVERLVLKESNR